ncbi:MAG: M20/M25/M40 family metallo-hydrolase [Acidobacteria bacterium]|nr:M20/M25/M40 family metallo-hydrolase [Acidobacteriota bacterium]
MRRLLCAALVLALVAATGVAAPPVPEPDRLLEHIKFLSSDELQGRGNGSEGLERAADYIAAQFKAAGLRPGVPSAGAPTAPRSGRAATRQASAGWAVRQQGGPPWGGSSDWFQPFELAAGLTVGDGNALVIQGRGRSVRLMLGESYIPLAVTPGDSPLVLDDVPVVFAGYGIAAPSVDYDDYAGLDVNGKAVLIFSHEPQEARRDSRLNGARPLQETTLYNKAAAARSRGARALIVVSDPSHRVDEANYRAFTIEADAEDHGLPVLRARRDEMAPLLRDLGLDQLAAEIDRDLTSRSRALAGTTIDYTQRLAVNRRMVRNVVGVLPGADDARDEEAIVIGGHYDHVGLGGRFSSSPERTGEIHNGADDNASGIAALIEVARVAAADRARFPRTLVFVAFAGEERGLLGSAHYAEHPVVPLADTVAMLNLDMIGRARGRVEIGGLSAASSLRADVEAAAQAAGLDARPGGPGPGRSDDSNFLDRRIPALHFFTGFHEDYHRPTDDWPRIDAAGTARVATLAIELAARLAARVDRPPFTAR